MKAIKLLALLIVSAFLIVPAEAAKNDKGKKKEAEKQKKREENAKKRDAINDFMRPLDKNRDGSLSLEEFLAGESNKEEGLKKFQRFNKNGDRSLTKTEIAEMLGL